MISLTKDKELKGYKSLTVYPEVAHFVTTRHGGVSEGTYGSFNCSPYTKDSCINVNCNQNKLFQITGHQIKELVIPEQKHGSASLVVDESFFKESLEVRRTLLRKGEVQEWLNWPAWKASKPLKGFRGSNPLLSAG